MACFSKNQTENKGSSNNKSLNLLVVQALQIIELLIIMPSFLHVWVAQTVPRFQPFQDQGLKKVGFYLFSVTSSNGTFAE